MKIIDDNLLSHSVYMTPERVSVTEVGSSTTITFEDDNGNYINIKLTCQSVMDKLKQELNKIK